jgi:hypothetical protein
MYEEGLVLATLIISVKDHRGMQNGTGRFSAGKYFVQAGSTVQILGGATGTVTRFLTSVIIPQIAIVNCEKRITV